MNINKLSIELTRQCNMECEHCLRGERQDRYIAKSDILTLCEQLKDGYIFNLTLTGGEPSLAVDQMEFILSSLVKYNIHLASFYIATNGVAISDNFVISCLKYYAYSEEKDMCCVQVSNDYFHAVQGSYSTELLDGLSFFARKHPEEAAQLSNKELINQGYYKENFNDGRPEEVHEMIYQDDFDDADIYLNVNGVVINGCDWSYSEQQDHVLCCIEDIDIYYNSLKKED